MRQPMAATNCSKQRPTSTARRQTRSGSAREYIRSIDGTHSAFVDFVPTHAEQPHSQTDVTFHKYGDTDYLNRIWVNGQSFGMKVEPTKAETKAATNASVVEHSVVASNR